MRRWESEKVRRDNKRMHIPSHLFTFPPSHLLNPVECLFQVFDDIVYILDTYRKAD